VAALAWDAIREHRRASGAAALVVLALMILMPWIATMIVLVVFGAGVAVALVHSDIFGERVRGEEAEDW
jgi:hypothetical protein